jgi:hypothetical protein
MVSTVKVTNIDTPDNTGNITFDRPIAGDGSNLTGVAPTKATVEALGIDLPAANLTGTVAAARLPDLGAWKLIGSQDASTSASLTQTGLGTAYETYAILICDMVPTTSGADCWIRLGDSSGIDSGASDYGYHTQNMGCTSTSYVASADASASHIKVATSVSHFGGGAMSGLYYMQRPANSTTGIAILPHIHGHHFNVTHPSLAPTMGGVYGVRSLVNMGVDRIQVLFSTGNISSGTFIVYGISNT